MHLQSLTFTGLVAIWIFLALASPAEAYIDPTAAGAALQSLYLIIMSALMFVVLLPAKVSAFFSGIKQRFRPQAPPVPSDAAAPEREPDAPTPHP